MTLSQESLSILAVAAASAALVSLALTMVLASRLRKVRARLRRRLPDVDAPLPADARELAIELNEIRDVMSHAVQCVGLVRFDAFEDMGGKLSFAAALLDAAGDGIVLSSINGRSETRIYAKPIERGASRYNLSDEEFEAVRRALGAVRR